MPNDKQRQKRLEQKRKRREKRKDKPDRALPPQRLLGLPKLSEVLTNFAAPLLDAVSDEADAQGYRSALLLASIIWNDAIEESATGEHSEAFVKLRAEMPERIGLSEQEFTALDSTLRARKKRLYPADDRMVVNVDVQDEGDRLNVVAMGYARTAQIS